MTEAVIFLPGIMGSELYSKPGKPDGELIWPGTFAELLLPYKKMDQLLDPDLVVGDIIRSFSGFGQYETLIEALVMCGFKESGDKPTLRVCPYDWRKDNAIAADRLAEEVVALREIHGPTLVLNLVAHSMGGLVSRFFLESGKYSEDSHPGFASVRRLMTIGTPHRGAPIALHAALGQVKRLFLDASQVGQIAKDPNFPALYQLMPPPSEPFLWDSRLESRLSPKSPHDPDVSKKWRLSQPNLDSAAAFHASLNPAKRPKEVDYFCFVGTRQPTISNVKFDFGIASGVLPTPTSTDDGGDGTVPSWSASFAGMQQLLIGGDHGTLYKPKEVLQAMAALLGKTGVLKALDHEKIRLSLRDEVVQPGQREPLVLFLSHRKIVDAEIVLRKVTDGQGAKVAPPNVIKRIPVRYDGPTIETMTLEIETPRYAGVYEIDIEADGISQAERVLVMLVQQT